MAVAPITKNPDGTVTCLGKTYTQCPLKSINVKGVIYKIEGMRETTNDGNPCTKLLTNKVVGETRVELECEGVIPSEKAKK